jgi:formylglycine-generating enzyme required for sulfatase activity
VEPPFALPHRATKGLIHLRQTPTLSSAASHRPFVSVEISTLTTGRGAPGRKLDQRVNYAVRGRRSTVKSTCSRSPTFGNVAERIAVGRASTCDAVRILTSDGKAQPLADLAIRGGGAMRLLLAILALVVSAASAAHADKRVALVIGNGAYRNVTALLNPRNDANDIAASLKRLNFSVNRVIDGTFDDMRRALLQFGREAVGADMAVIYYSGHGMEIGGENWLIPIDAELQSDRDAESEAIPLRSAMLQAANGSSLGLVILDACRSNPFAAKMQRSKRYRSVDRGLVRVEPSDNVLVAYAAREGTVASDGDGKHSPFTAALLDNLETPGLEINFLFRNVRDEVLAATKREQQPFVYGSLSKQAIYLKEPQDAAAAANQQVQMDAAQAWAAAKDTTSPAVLESFITRYGDSLYAELARARLDELKKNQVAVVAPPVASVAPAASSGPCGGTPITVSLSVRSAEPLSAAEECALKPRDVFKECDKCPEMVVVPAGSFIMGSPDSEKGSTIGEGPQHAVTISRALAVGKFSVTVDQFSDFFKEAGYDAGSKCHTFEHGKAEERSGRSFRDPGFSQTGSHPAVCLDWDDAKAYVAWLSKKTGKPYRLLTEAEWEYAARGRTEPGSYPRYFFGDNEDDMCRYGNGADQTAKSKIAGFKDWTIFNCSDGYAYTAPVGSFRPNPFGLHDMHGNAWQWVEDCWHDNYQGTPNDGSAWTSGDCGLRVLRGGSWANSPKSLRAANRSIFDPANRTNNGGFRIARTLTQ